MPTILIADDSLVTVQVLSLILRREGFDVRTAVDGREAFELLHAEPIDLLIADLQMPELDGLELVRLLHGEPAHTMPPVIMLTSSAAEHDRISADSEGVDTFLMKPVASSELIDAVNRLLIQSAT